MTPSADANSSSKSSKSPSAATAAAWKIGKRGAQCATCEREFAPHEVIVSALFECHDDDPDSPEFRRSDTCADCFSEAPEGAPPPFSWWRAELPPPQPARATFDLGVAREFLVRLLVQDEPARASLRYLLALMLMRKRIARVEEQFTDERGDVMVIRLPPDETHHEIVCPELSEEETLSLRDELGRLFDMGGDAD